ncbi:MAG: phosphatase PAP2 family protein [Flavihumibacter sp.]|nr:phosphatase PAP2 family protein [Flavihumibacter sp.]
MENNGLADNFTNTSTPVASAPAYLKIPANIFSILFHPLFIPAYITAYLLYLHPYAFAGIPQERKIFTLIPVIFNTFFLPAFSVFIMKQLGFVSSIRLQTQRDRVIPYITSMIFYFWIWYVARNTPDMPKELVAFLLATFLITIAGLMSNIYFKVSMHTMAAGALLVFFIWYAFASSVPVNTYLAAAILITGLVATSRLIAGAHTSFEIYAGLFIGAACQLISIFIAG